MADKDFFITYIPMIELQNDTHIPTVFFYGNQNEISIGNEAKAASKEVDHELSLKTLRSISKRMILHMEPLNDVFRLPVEFRSSPGEIAGDFLDQLLKKIAEWLPAGPSEENARIVVARSDSECRREKSRS